MRKNKISISIFTLMCVISTIVGYSLLKPDSNKYNQLAIMTQQNDGSYIRSNMSAFGNDDYEFNHAVCNNGTTVTANSNGGVNLKLLGSDKCTVYLKKIKFIDLQAIKDSAKTTKPDFTQIAPLDYVPGENFTVNHIYDGYTNIEKTSNFGYDATTKKWSAAGDGNISFNLSENKENIAICYEYTSEMGADGDSNIQFYKNNIVYYRDQEGSEPKTTIKCLKIGNIASTDKLKFNISISGLIANFGASLSFYLVDDYTVTDTSSGVYIADDDYGKSYYFRGDIENNYVKFGDFYWRIVRINGDDSLRLIYDGTKPHANGELSPDRVLLGVAFNILNNNNAYVGYMYGNINGTTYDEVHKSTKESTSSEIKKYLDGWYETNIRDKGLSKYVSDTLFCNDRSVTSGTGIGTTDTYYATHTRSSTNKDPILTCPQKNDAFTVNDIVKGNGALTYPIGLLTVDEYRLAGGKIWTQSINSYMNKPGVYWRLISPFYYRGYTSGFSVYTDGKVGDSSIINTNSAAPVINLDAEYSLRLKGTGTVNDPYHF